MAYVHNRKQTVRKILRYLSRNKNAAKITSFFLIAVISFSSFPNKKMNHFLCEKIIHGMI